MKKLITITALLFALSLMTSVSHAQVTSNQTLTMGIPQVLLINAVNASGVTGAVSLNLTTTTAGTAISGGSGTSYAQISSIVNSGETRNISATVTGVPAGTTLSVASSTPGANAAGTLGTGSAAKLLGASSVDLVTGIGSCYTGTAAGDGYKLDYVWDAGSAGSYGTIFATTEATATVILTLSAGQ